MNRLKSRVIDLEIQVAELKAILIEGRRPAAPGESDYRRAVEAAVEKGDTEDLARYLRRGGRIPVPETIQPTAAMQRGGSASRDSTNLPLAAQDGHAPRQRAAARGL